MIASKVEYRIGSLQDSWNVTRSIPDLFDTLERSFMAVSANIGEMENDVMAVSVCACLA